MFPTDSEGRYIPSEIHSVDAGLVRLGHDTLAATRIDLIYPSKDAHKHQTRLTMETIISPERSTNGVYPLQFRNGTTAVLSWDTLLDVVRFLEQALADHAPESTVRALLDWHITRYNAIPEPEGEPGEDE